MDSPDNVVGRGKRHQQQIMDDSQSHLLRQVGHLTEENSRMDVQIDELERELKMIKALLERAKGLAWMTLLERDGLVEVIRHLKEEWTPPDSELHYKDKIKPLMDKMVEVVKGDPKKLEKAREAIERIVSEPLRQPGPDEAS